jgi:MarR family transcriptional regulator, temperature-dependent positive regulator of motility
MVERALEKQAVRPDGCRGRTFCFGCTADGGKVRSRNPTKVRFNERLGAMIEYKVIREIEKNPSHTQRSLAEKLDISLGKVNYVLAGLIEKGIIKAKKLKRNPGQIRWQYILTPDGMKEKVRITKEYLEKRINEFVKLQDEIVQLKKEV